MKKNPSSRQDASTLVSLDRKARAVRLPATALAAVQGGVITFPESSSKE